MRERCVQYVSIIYVLVWGLIYAITINGKGVRGLYCFPHIVFTVIHTGDILVLYLT